jgi:hypothetical protein
MIVALIELTAFFSGYNAEAEHTSHVMSLSKFTRRWRLSGIENE